MASGWLPHYVIDIPNFNYLAILGLGAVTLYASLRYIYNVYFHPASKFPGPRLAAISNTWYGYHWASGKYPWALLEAFEKYGDVVRVAPNQLAFITPQAFSDIYDTYVNGREHFPKTDFFELGFEDNGISWEKNPAKHHAEAKKLAPAFSLRAIKAKESTMHKYIDAFVQKMREIGDSKNGIELKTVSVLVEMDCLAMDHGPGSPRPMADSPIPGHYDASTGVWTDWVAMDTSADLAYSRETHHLRDMTSAGYIHEIWNVNFFVIVNAIFKKFPLLEPIKWVFIPPSAALSFFKSRRMNERALQSSIKGRGNREHLDHFDALLPADAPLPTKPMQKHLEVVVGHLVIAGYEPIASQNFCTIMFSLLDSKVLGLLIEEIRGEFQSYDDIHAEALGSLKFLHAALMETLRITVLSSSGQPRTSPGAMVDGNYVPKGVDVEYGVLAFTRSPRYFYDGYSYRPQRWLPEDHPHWDPVFRDDARDGYHPFSEGPRSCPGMPLAWRQTRLFVAKVLWAFDVEMLPNQSIEFKRDFRMYAMWQKPEFRVRFHPVPRES